MPRKNKYKPRADGRFYTTVGTGKRNPDTGVEIRLQVYAKSSKELEEKVDEMKVQLKNGTYTPPNNISVSEYCDKFFRTFKIKKGLNTKNMYINAIDKHIKPSIGHIMVKDLTSSDCQLMINDRWKHPSTCEKIKLTMRQLQRMAIRDHIIQDEFWSNDIMELPPLPDPETRALFDYEREAIKNASFDMQDQAFVYFIFGCGVRRGEALALSAFDIKLDIHELNIENAVIFDVNTPYIKDTPKTENGIRRIHIPISVFQVLQFFTIYRMKEYAAQNGLNYNKLTDTQKAQIHLFRTRNGDLMTKSSYDKMWARIMRQINFAVMSDDEIKLYHRLPADKKKKFEWSITGLTSKTFRHNYATLLYYSGISELKAVELMGHADGKMIHEVYAHLDEEKENANERLDQQIAL